MATQLSKWSASLPRRQRLLALAASLYTRSTRCLYMLSEPSVPGGRPARRFAMALSHPGAAPVGRREGKKSSQRGRYTTKPKSGRESGDRATASGMVAVRDLGNAALALAGTMLVGLDATGDAVVTGFIDGPIEILVPAVDTEARVLWSIESDAMLVLAALSAALTFFQEFMRDRERGIFAGAVFFALCLGVAMGKSEGPVVGGLKEYFARERPSWSASMSYAYPSGHTAFVSLVGACCFLVVQPGSGGGKSRAGPWLWLTMNIAVGAGRVFSGKHWPSDIVGGSLLGLAGASLLHAALTLQPRARRS